MNDEQKKLYEFHRQEIRKIMIDVITSKGIGLSFFKNFMISVFVIAAVLLFVVASFTPWIVGVGLGVVVGSAIVKVLLADLEYPLKCGCIIVLKKVLIWLLIIF